MFSALGNPSMAIISVVAGAITAKNRRQTRAGDRPRDTRHIRWTLPDRAAEPWDTHCHTHHPGLRHGMVSATVQALVAVWFPAKERGTAQGALAAFYGASTSIVTIYASFMSAQQVGVVSDRGLYAAGMRFRLRRHRRARLQGHRKRPTA